MYLESFHSVSHLLAVFTKLLQSLVERWRSLGTKAVVCIDGIVASKSETLCLEHEEIVLSLLRGRFLFISFILSTNKCCLKPCQIGDCRFCH